MFEGACSGHSASLWGRFARDVLDCGSFFSQKPRPEAGDKVSASPGEHNDRSSADPTLPLHETCRPFTEIRNLHVTGDGLAAPRDNHHLLKT